MLTGPVRFLHSELKCENCGTMPFQHQMADALMETILTGRQSSGDYHFGCPKSPNQVRTYFKSQPALRRKLK